MAAVLPYQLLCLQLLFQVLEGAVHLYICRAALAQKL